MGRIGWNIFRNNSWGINWLWIRRHGSGDELCSLENATFVFAFPFHSSNILTLRFTSYASKKFSYNSKVAELVLNHEIESVIPWPKLSAGRKWCWKSKVDESDLNPLFSFWFFSFQLISVVDCSENLPYKKKGEDYHRTIYYSVPYALL